MSDQRSFGIVYPLWSHADGGGDLLDRAIGEVGIDHITVPVVTGPLVAYRAYATEPPRVFTTDGGWHYPPNTKAYAGVKPKTAGWFGKRDLLARVCETAEKRGVQVYFRIDMRNIPALLERNPHLRGRNCFGDEMTYAGACLCNPQMRELMEHTLGDLRRYPVAGFELVECEPNPAMAIDVAATSETLGLVMRNGAEHCFCPACRQIAAGAGFELERALSGAQGDIADRLQGPYMNGDADGLCEATAVNEYREVRRADISAWLSNIASRFGDQPIRLVVGGGVDPTPGCQYMFRDELLYSRFSREWRQHLPEFLPTGGGSGLGYPAWRPVVDSADELVRFVHEVQQRGVTFFDFEHLDESPSEAIDWLRQAVRYAHRE